MREIRFFSLNKPDDWHNGVIRNLQVSDKGLRLKQTHKYAVQSVLQMDELLPDTRVRDCSFGQKGELYVLDDHAQLLVYDTVNDHSEQLFREGHGLFTANAGICWLPGAVIVADYSDAYPLSACSVTNGQTLWSFSAWQGEEFTICSAISDMKQYVYALVRLQGEQGGLAIAKLDRHGALQQLFRHDALTCADDEKPEQTAQRWKLAASPEDDVYALNTAAGMLLKFHVSGALAYRLMLDIEDKPGGIACDRAGFIYIGSGRELERNSEDNRFIRKFDATGMPEAHVTAFRGSASKLIIDPDSRMAVWNEADSVMTVLALEARTREMAETGLPEGVMLSLAIDSGEAETRWHKVWLDADIPESTQIRITAYASDFMEVVTSNGLEKLDDVLQDDNVPFEQKMHVWETITRQLDQNRAGKPGITTLINPQDALLFDTQGQYLWLKVEFAGSEGLSPTLRRLRAYFPRQSPMSYLPGIYAEEDKTGFLERFLSMFGTLFLELDEEIADISRYFDPEAVSGEYLRWLAGWVGIVADDHWSDDKLRAWIAEAPELYRKRGTREGISRMIEMYTGEQPIIIEYHQLKDIRSNSDFSELVSQLYSMDPYTFCVLMKAELLETERERAIVERLIEEQKPAFTECRLVKLQPWLYIDMHTYLGINTILTEPTLLRLDNTSSMPNSTTLIDVELDNRLDSHTRLNLDSELES